MSLVRLDDVVREVGTFVILDHVTAAIALGDRIGLVGPNGAGKTTLLRIVAGRDEPDRGEVHLRRGLSVGLLSQEAHLDEAFMAAPDLRAAVRHGARHLETMERELRAMESGGRVADPRYADLQHRFETLGGYTLDQRVEAALSGLGFERAEWSRPPTALSGGQQTRATLARLVVADPELLLLDEPTNHLDLAALEWLEEHLRRRSGSLVVASHDRAFLDGTVTRIWELRDRGLTAFRGDYSAYHRQREERDTLAVKQAGTHADQVAREQELVQRYRSQRKYSKMHEHEARLERLRDEAPVAPRKKTRLVLPTGALAGGGPARSGELVVRLEGLEIGYLPRGSDRPESEPGEGPSRGEGPIAYASNGRGEDDGWVGRPALDAPKVVARVPFLAAQRGERIGIVGPNGAGKTTLLRTIAGDLPPLDGGIAFGHAVQLGYLAQLRGAAIPGATVLDALLDSLPVTPGEARSYLARFLFRGDDVLKEVRTLSGGERSRLELALLGILPSNLLLLDEPTNHLDIPAREAIETFLAESPATILVVSHDRRLLETVCDRLWVVDDGLAVPFDGGYRAWRAAVADGWTPAGAAEVQSRRLTPGANREAFPSGAATSGGRDANMSGGRGVATGAAARRGGAGGTGRGAGTRGTSPPAGGGARVATAPAGRLAGGKQRGPRLSKEAYRRQSALVEGELTRLGLRKSHLELALADPGTQRNFVELRRVTSELADVERALVAAEEAWLELEERAP